MPAAKRQPTARRPQEGPLPGFRSTAASREKVGPLPPKRFSFQPGGDELLHAFVPPIRGPGRVEQADCQGLPRETFRPVRSIGNAASNPTNSGKRWVPPQAGSRPNLISGRPSRVEIVIAGDPVAAGQGKLQSAPQARPVNDGHRRHGKSFQPVEQLLADDHDLFGALGSS